MNNDLRFALRQLLKNPGFTVVAVLTLTLGIGLTASIFTVLNAAAFRALPIRGSDRLVTIFQSFSDQGGTMRRNVYGDANRASYSEYRHYRNNNRVFTGLIAYAPSIAATLGGDQPHRILGTLASCNYFDVLQASPSLGRGFIDSDCGVPGEGAVVVLSDDFWRTEFRGDPSIVGTVITLNRTPFVVVGIAPPGFRGTEAVPTGFWVPLTAQGILIRDQDFLRDDQCGWLVLMGRLKDGMSIGQVRADLGVLAANLDKTQPGRLTTLRIARASSASGPQMRSMVLSVGTVILTAVGLVLLIACANVANLLLARAVDRRKEIALRLAIGASRWRLIRQLLTENVLLALLGGALGLLFAFWASAVVMQFVQSHLPPGLPPFTLNVGPDSRVLIFTILLTAITAIAFGLVPALRASQVELNVAMKEGSNPPEGNRRSRGLLRSGLVAAQVAGCMVLLLVTGLSLRGLYRAQFIDPGFRMKNVIVATFDLAGAGYPDQRAETFQRQMFDRIVGIAGVEAVAQARSAPLSNRHYGDLFSLRGHENGFPIEFNNVSPGFFKLLDIPIVQGRNFTASESQTGAHVAIVTESTVRRLWSGQDPIGNTLRKGALRPDAEDLEIVGVAKDSQVSHLADSQSPYLYLPAGPKEQIDLQLLVRSRGENASVAAGIGAAVGSVDSGIAVDIARLEQNFELFRFPGRIVSILSGALGSLALFLALIGVYGVVSFVVRRRVREIGIRTALGADARDVLMLILRQAMWPVAGGIAVGMIGCAAASNILSSVLYGISPHDPVSFLVVPGLLLAVAMLASYLPARNATRIDPVKALRCE